MAPVLAIMPASTAATHAPNLFMLEEGLQTLLDSAELVDPDQQAAFNADLEASLTAAVTKRDRVNHFLIHCESQSAAAAIEIKRLQGRKLFFDAVVERVELSVVRTIRNLGLDAKGNYKKLEGETVTLSVKRSPATVAITDEAAVPAAYKSISITLPALTWEALLDSLDMETRAKVLDEVKRPDSTVIKALVKAAIEAAAPDGWKDRLKEEAAAPVCVESVPGASIVAGSLSLVRK